MKTIHDVSVALTAVEAKIFQDELANPFKKDRASLITDIEDCYLEYMACPNSVLKEKAVAAAASLIKLISTLP